MLRRGRWTRLPGRRERPACQCHESSRTNRYGRERRGSSLPVLQYDVSRCARRDFENATEAAGHRTGSRSEPGIRGWNRARAIRLGRGPAGSSKFGAPLGGARAEQIPTQSRIRASGRRRVNDSRRRWSSLRLADGQRQEREQEVRLEEVETKSAHQAPMSVHSEGAPQRVAGRVRQRWPEQNRFATRTIEQETNSHIIPFYSNLTLETSTLACISDALDKTKPDNRLGYHGD